MSAKLFKASGKRKDRVVVLRAELYRERGAAAWRLSLRYGGKRATILDTGTAIEAAAEEFAVMAIRNITAPQQPAASSQQPAASSQQPAASSQQPAASSQQPAASRAASNIIPFPIIFFDDCA